MEVGVLKLRGWTFKWDEHGGGLTIYSEDDLRRVRLDHAEVTRLLDIEPY